MRKFITIFAAIAILAVNLFGSANPAAAAGCPTINGRAPTLRSAVKCHYDFPQSISIRVHTSNPDQSVDLWDDDLGNQPGQTSGDFKTNSFTLNFGATVEVLDGGSVTQAQPSPSQQPAPQITQTQPTQGLPPGWCFQPLPDDQQFVPAGKDDAAYAAQLLLGDSSKAGMLSLPEPDRLPGTWILRNPGKTCVFVPWFVEIEFNVGNGTQKVTGPTFLEVVDQATIRFNTDLGPKKPGTPTGGGACFTIDQNALFAPNTGDQVQAAKVFAGNANRAGDFVWPEPDRLPNVIVFRTTEPKTCLLNPGWVEIEYNVGQGTQISNLPGFVTVAGQATIRINTAIAPVKSVKLFIPLLRKAA